MAPQRERTAAGNAARLRANGALDRSQSGAEDARAAEFAPGGSDSGAEPPPEERKFVPTVFRWEHGGNTVFIAGTFNGWTTKIRMARSGQDFSTILNLPQDVYAYKFNVDGEWRFAPEQPTAEDRHGGVNNFIDLKTFRSFHEGWRSQQRREERGEGEDTKGWGTTIPGMEAYAKEPPMLPPHLRHILLNTPVGPTCVAIAIVCAAGACGARAPARLRLTPHAPCPLSRSTHLLLLHLLSRAPRRHRRGVQSAAGATRSAGSDGWALVHYTQIVRAACPRLHLALQAKVCHYCVLPPSTRRDARSGGREDADVCGGRRRRAGGRRLRARIEALNERCAGDR